MIFYHLEIRDFFSVTQPVISHCLARIPLLAHVSHVLADSQKGLQPVQLLIRSRGKAIFGGHLMDIRFFLEIWLLLFGARKSFFLIRDSRQWSFLCTIYDAARVDQR
ncbi:hypothetical protein JR316_0006867 [Psilocybe cubensis]|uniref:Uncharacterized protein n=1 Tax=Psilocybe cubensis TaxID=181762 RepID=A0ACB8GXS3_PSICU|nr:hypothetical protein JR316_0006867 [Psilocybe cubensis]KAH9480269.1 hypothetical protein JR316_0006867 [Psilocybe cubensis]